MAATRQLAAIMCTDIDGYASLIQQDGSLAAELKVKHREILHRLAAKFHGRILQNIGHDSLSLFSSAVEAVQCAIEMQLAFREEAALAVKIGIHLGDIIFTDEEAIGDGIKVARKIETQSEPGGILISNKIYQEVKNQAGIETRYLKACELEEQGQLVEVYAITNKGIEAPEGSRNGRQPGPDGHASGSGLRHFWEEAKRRNVVRVVAMYAGATFVIIDLINNIADPLGLPRWLPTVVILLLIMGFPATAIFSWIFDFTPEGIRRTVPRNEFELAVSKQSPASDTNWFNRHRIFRRYLVPLLVLGLLGGVYFFKDNIFRNWERINKVAREHTEKARLYNDNLADPALVKEELDLALAADPDYSRALYIYALVHLREGDTVLSKQKLHAVVESDPGYANAWDLLATYAFKQDSFELAMGYSLKALGTDPDRTFPTFNMALQFEDRGFYDQAIELYRKTTQMDSTFTPGYSALGALYNKMNRPADAIQTLHRSLSISPASMDNYLVYKNLAESHYILKDYDQALEYLEQSKALQADYPETEKCFARCYEATGDTESSILHWRIYLALETDSLERLLAQQRLDSLRSISSP